MAAANAPIQHPAALFLRPFMVKLNHAVNVLASDAGSSVELVSRLEALERSLERVRGNTLPEALAEQLGLRVGEILAEARMKLNPESTGQTGYKAARLPSGSRGASKFAIQRCQVEFLLSLRFTVPEMADIFHVSKRTIERRLMEWNLQKRQQFSDISDAELDILTAPIARQNSQVGPNSVKASLASRGVNLQRRRVRESMERVDPGGAAIRAVSGHAPVRRLYKVSGPNALWHVDGHHKLIRWGFVIHGGIDGHSRLVPFLRVSTNNRPETVLAAFQSGCNQFGVPSRVRTDRGGENVAVAAFMEEFRGEYRNSVIQGTSVHNQRIERLWGDVRRVVVDPFHQLFSTLEQISLDDGEPLLDETEEKRWALHYIYLPRIQQALDNFTSSWNNHGLSTEHYRSPLQLFARDSLRRCNSTLTAMQDMFSQRRPTFDGTEDPATSRYPCPVNEEKKAELEGLVNPLSEDNEQGSALLCQCVVFLKANRLG